MKDPLEKKTWLKRAALIFAALSAGLYVFFKDVESGKIQSRAVAASQLTGLIGDSTKSIATWATDSVPQMYKLSMLYTQAKMKAKGYKFIYRVRLAGIHKVEVKRLVDVEAMRLMSSMEGVRKNAYFSLDEAFRIKAKNKALAGINKAQAITESKKDLVKLLKAKGYDGLKDARGVVWDLNRYSEMAVRTIHTEVHNTAIVNVALENGYDLVQLTHSPKPCEHCLPFDGAVISLTGTTKGYPSLEEIRAAGVWHPNCKHSFTPITEIEAEELPK